MVRQSVTVLNQTPSAFRVLTDAARTGERRNALRWVMFGGEALELTSLAPWYDLASGDGPRLVNMYGITETTVHVTWRPISEPDLASGASVIGRAIPDLALHLTDRRLEPVPFSVAGEIFVGGAGPARGYLGRSALSAERFVPDPWSDRPGERLYKTGDLARRRADGDLEYLGRADHQVKIRALPHRARRGRGGARRPTRRRRCGRAGTRRRSAAKARNTWRPTSCSKPKRWSQPPSCAGRYKTSFLPTWCRRRSSSSSPCRSMPTASWTGQPCTPGPDLLDRAGPGRHASTQPERRDPGGDLGRSPGAQTSRRGR